MRRLILVKHSLPKIEPAVLSHRWRLGEEGRRRCATLAERLTPHAPVAVVASTEPKAAETGEIVAGRLGLPFEAIAGLRENDRTGLGYLGDAEYEARFARFFAEPTALVVGRETAAGAGARFAGAVEGVVARYASREADPWRDGSLVVVAHGTVISLFVARHTGAEPFPLWRRLGLPSFVVLAVPDLALLETVERVGAGDQRG